MKGVEDTQCRGMTRVKQSGIATSKEGSGSGGDESENYVSHAGAGSARN